MHSIKHLPISVLPWRMILLFSFVLTTTNTALYAQQVKSSNTSLSLATSFRFLDAYSIPPIGIIGELGLPEWATVGVYGGYSQLRFFRLDGWTAGGRITLQLRGIAEEIMETPLNTFGIKPYIGIAGGWFVNERQRGGLYHQFSYSPVFGVRYYPIDCWGLLVEWGETFNGLTGLNVGVSYGGRR